MKPLNKYNKEFFDKYKEKPVHLIDYGFEVQELADKYLLKAKELLNGMAEVGLIGSAAYKIPGSDVEIAVYPHEENFSEAIKILTKEFGKPAQEQPEFVRFEIIGEKYDTDIHVYRGYEAEVSKKLTKYMLDHPILIKEYKKLKEKYCYSKREYQYEKYLFINKIVESIPENYA